jgi:hypothetical protein
MWVVLALASLAACHRRAAPGAGARARVLAQLPADARAVIAADGHALAHPRARSVIDLLAPRWPARMGCVIDAMYVADEVAVAIGPRGTTVALATAATPDCPALAHVDDGLWIATLGAGTVARGASVLDDARFDRARPYLLASPIAAAIERAGGTIVAAAQPEPLDAWLVFDATPALAEAAHARVAGAVAQLAKRPVTGPFAQHVEVTRTGAQVRATLHGPVDADLALAVRLAIDELEPVDAPPDPWPCPAPTFPVARCIPGPVFTVTSVFEALRPLQAQRLEPVIANTRVRGLRVTDAVPALGFRAGDVLIGAGGRPLGARAQLDALAVPEAKRLELVVDRGGVATTVSLVAR